MVLSESEELPVTEDEVKKVFARILKKKFENRHTASDGALTYDLQGDGKVYFARWVYLDGKMISRKLAEPNQTLAQNFFGRLVLDHNPEKKPVNNLENRVVQPAMFA